VASYIKERTKNAQFIVISLRNNMFELASRLVGVYKVNHMVSFFIRPLLDHSAPMLTFVLDQECHCRKQRLLGTSSDIIIPPFFSLAFWNWNHGVNGRMHCI
jgi:hypothetical protein